MKILHDQALEVAGQFWRHRWLSIGAAWLVCLLGWVAVATIPTKYESKARVYVNADGLLTPLLRGLAVNDDPSRHLAYLRRTLLSRPNLKQVVRLAGLDLGTESSVDQDARLSTLADEIRLRPESRNLLWISYRNRNPAVAKNVVQSLLTIFAENTTGSNRAEMENATRFLDEQIARYEKKLAAAELRRAEFRQKYLDFLPGLNGAVSKLDATRANLQNLRLRLADAESKRDSIKKELAKVPQFLSVDSMPQVVVGGRSLSPRAQLEQARAKLTDLLERDTEQHPDVIAERRKIAFLEAEMRHDKGGDQGDPEKKSQITNNVYQQLKIRLSQADANVAAAKRALAMREADAQALEKKARTIPDVEAKAEGLDRNYSMLKRTYETLLQRRESARMSRAADIKANKIQFRIVDAPQIPITPISPNRPLLDSGVLVVGLFTGLAVPILLWQLDQSFSSVGNLRRLGLPVLGSISRMTIPGARRRLHVQAAGLCVGTLVLFAVYGVLLTTSLKFLRASIS